MKILAYTVRSECPACGGKKRLRARENDQNGEMVECYTCSGHGHVEEYVKLDDFMKFVRGLVKIELDLEGKYRR